MIIIISYNTFNILCTACELNAIRNVLHVNRNLVQSKLYGYEGSDVFEVIKNASITII